jgi:hypothetical protein
MSDIKDSVVPTKGKRGGARPGAGRKPSRAVVRALQRVELIRGSKQPDEIAVTTPQGYRIEGLTIEQTIALLRVLS